MKRIISLAIALIIASLAVVSVNAALTHPDYPGLEFANDFDDNLSVTGYTGEDPVLVVPAMVYDKAVTRFEEKALMSNNVVQSVNMNDNMTNIRQRALYQCKSLTYVYYSKKLQVVSSYAFAYDTQLPSALLRNTAVRQVANNAYMSCSNLGFVSFPDTLESIENSAFEKTAVRKIVIPNGVGSIGARCFSYASKLEKIYVPASVLTIGTDVLYNSPNVTVYTPEGSAMQTYCENKNINYVNLSEEDFPSRLVGDVNGDREVNINDVTVMQREIAGYNTDFYCDNCDVDCNCKFNIDDATEVQLRLVGLK